MSNEELPEEDECKTEEQNEVQVEQIMGPPSSTQVIKSVIKPHSQDNSCDVCCQTFPDSVRLKYHIRSLHFNLKAKIISYDDKEINQVWFEKVYNTSKIVEIKKARHNLFLIRKLDDNTQVTIQECAEVTDLSELYPTKRAPTLGVCHICKQTLLKRDLKKHYDERHMQIKKHHCNNCNKSFKRSVAYCRHICHKTRGRPVTNKWLLTK